MAIWTIADIHASRADPRTGRPSKPMDLFGEHWQDHLERISAAWNATVDETDTVVIAGDIDWALYLEDALETLLWLDSLPGEKILLRGNHDYWWSSKTTNRVRRSLPPSLALLHNNAYQVDGINICGAKGSPVPGGIDWTDENAKLLHREAQRLLMSLESRDESLPTLVALHYPPFYPAFLSSPYKDIMDNAGVGVCVYGHLHGRAAAAGPSGEIDDIEYRLVAADALGFAPICVARDGRILKEADARYNARETAHAKPPP